jgi:hypothetical protein
MYQVAVKAKSTGYFALWKPRFDNANTVCSVYETWGVFRPACEKGFSPHLSFYFQESEETDGYTR